MFVSSSSSVRDENLNPNQSDYTGIVHCLKSSSRPVRRSHVTNANKDSQRSPLRQKLIFKGSTTTATFDSPHDFIPECLDGKKSSLTDDLITDGSTQFDESPTAVEGPKIVMEVQTLVNYQSYTNVVLKENSVSTVKKLSPSILSPVSRKMCTIANRRLSFSKGNLMHVSSEDYSRSSTDNLISNIICNNNSDNSPVPLSNLMSTPKPELVTTDSGIESDIIGIASPLSSSSWIKTQSSPIEGCRLEKDSLAAEITAAISTKKTPSSRSPVVCCTPPSSGNKTEGGVSLSRPGMQRRHSTFSASRNSDCEATLKQQNQVYNFAKDGNDKDNVSLLCTKHQFDVEQKKKCDISKLHDSSDVESFERRQDSTEVKSIPTSLSNYSKIDKEPEGENKSIDFVAIGKNVGNIPLTIDGLLVPRAQAHRSNTLPAEIMKENPDTTLSEEYNNNADISASFSFNETSINESNDQPIFDTDSYDNHDQDSFDRFEYEGLFAFTGSVANTNQEILHDGDKANIEDMLKESIKNVENFVQIPVTVNNTNFGDDSDDNNDSSKQDRKSDDNDGNNVNHDNVQKGDDEILFLGLPDNSNKSINDIKVRQCI